MKRTEAIKRLKQNKSAAEFYVELASKSKSIDNELKDIEAFNMAIEALQGDMYCPNCGVRLVPEDEYLESTQTNGRLIDADALLDKLPTYYFGSPIHLLINDAPTIQADRPHGEWIETSEGTMCGNCHKFPYDDGEYHIANWHSDFCPICGAKMTKGGKE